MIASPRRTWLGLAGWAVLLAVLLLLPGNVPRGTQEILLNLLLWVGIAQAWNLIGGIGGQLSLGHSVFIGTGGYTLAMAVLKADMPWPAALLLGGVLSGALAWLLSFPLLRLSGVYFTIGSSAVALIAQAWMVTWTWTGESRGLTIPLAAVPDRAVAFQVDRGAGRPRVRGHVRRAALHLRPAVDGGARRRGRRRGAGRVHPRGQAAGAGAQRDPHRPAGRCHRPQPGVHRAHLDVRPDWVVTALVMVVVGGMGTVAGPVIGAFVIYYLVDRALESEPVLQALLSGVLVIAVIVVAPDGIVGVLRDRGRRGHRPAGPPAPQRGAGPARHRRGQQRLDPTVAVGSAPRA